MRWAMGSSGTFASVWDPTPISALALRLVIGVVAVAIVVRLRDEDFGAWLGGALIAVGAVGLVLLCATVRGQVRYDGNVVIRSAHGQVSVPGFQDAVPR